MFPVNFLRLLSVWRLARRHPCAVVCRRSVAWLARAEAFGCSWAARRIQPDSQWRVSKLTALGRLPRAPGAPCRRVPSFAASKIEIEPLLRFDTQAFFEARSFKNYQASIFRIFSPFEKNFCFCYIHFTGCTNISLLLYLRYLLPCLVRIYSWNFYNYLFILTFWRVANSSIKQNIFLFYLKP